MDPLLRAGTRTSFRRRSRRTVHLHGARGEEATGSDSHLQAGIVAIPRHSTSLASTSGVPCRLVAPTDHPGPAAPPTLPYGAGVAGQGPPAAEAESPLSRASLNHQSSKDDSQLHNSCRQGWELMTQHPHKRYRHCRYFGRIERSTEFRSLPSDGRGDNPRSLRRQPSHSHHLRRSVSRIVSPLKRPSEPTWANPAHHEHSPPRHPQQNSFPERSGPPPT